MQSRIVIDLLIQINTDLENRVHSPENWKPPKELPKNPTKIRKTPSTKLPKLKKAGSKTKGNFFSMPKSEEPIPKSNTKKAKKRKIMVMESAKNLRAQKNREKELEKEEIIKRLLNRIN